MVQTRRRMWGPAATAWRLPATRASTPPTSRPDVPTRSLPTAADDEVLAITGQTFLFNNRLDRRRQAVLVGRDPV